MATGIKKTDLAYMAGLIDGEGCIKISRAVLKGRKFPRYNLQLQIDMVDSLEVLEWAQQKFGGKIYKHKRRLDYQKNCRDSERLYMFQADTKELLLMILPYMKIRHKQASLALEFLKCKARDPHKEVCFQQMKKLNKRGKQ